MLQIPQHILDKQAPSRATALTDGISGGSFPRVSTKQNRFTLIDAADNEKPVLKVDPKTGNFYMDVVIIDWNDHISKTYFESTYDAAAAEHAAPACQSDNGIGPSEGSEKPQSLTCATCPKNVWGSAIAKGSGKETKACNDGKKIAILVPDETGWELPLVFRIPPASLKVMRKYILSVTSISVGSRGAEPDEVITRVSFDPVTQGVLTFTPQGWVDKEGADAVTKMLNEKRTTDMLGKNDKPIQSLTASNALASANTRAQLAPVETQALAPISQRAKAIAPKKELELKQDQREFDNPPKTSSFGMQEPALLGSGFSEIDLAAAFGLPV